MSPKEVNNEGGNIVESSKLTFHLGAQIKFVSLYLKMKTKSSLFQHFPKHISNNSSSRKGLDGQIILANIANFLPSSLEILNTHYVAKNLRNATMEVFIRVLFNLIFLKFYQRNCLQLVLLSSLHLLMLNENMPFQHTLKSI